MNEDERERLNDLSCSHSIPMAATEIPSFALCAWCACAPMCAWLAKLTDRLCCCTAVSSSFCFSRLRCSNSYPPLAPLGFECASAARCMGSLHPICSPSSQLSPEISPPLFVGRFAQAGTVTERETRRRVSF